MKAYQFGNKQAPAILLLPVTRCHWKSNFENVIPLLADEMRVLCVSARCPDKWTALVKETAL